MDQIIRDNAEVSLEQGIGMGTQYMDAGAGAMLLSRRFWFGVSANHLTSPNVSLNPSLPEKLPVLYTAHGGARMRLVHGPRQHHQRDVVFSWKFMQQGDRNQLDLGAYYDLSILTLGVWYRGLPVQASADGSLDVDALSFVFGFGNREFKFGYSYDVTLNRLGLLGTAGSHEISAKYLWDVSRRRPVKARVHPCVDF